MSKVAPFRLTLLGAGLAVTLVGRAQESAPRPTTALPAAATPEEAPVPASPAPVPTPEAVAASPGAVSLPCVPLSQRGSSSRPQVPMPPELQGDVALVKTEAVRISTHLSISGPFFKGPSSTGGKAPSLKPFSVKDLAINPKKEESSRFDLSAFNVQFGFQSVKVAQTFSFRLVNDDTPAAAPVTVRCAWGLASSTTSGSKGKWGIEMLIPQGNSMACELFDAPDVSPWRLFLWVGPPSELIPPEFPSGGGLVRGEVRYEAASTNAAPLGLKSAMITATFFTKEGRAVAAVERLVPGRVVMPCSIPPAEQAIFVAIGAALYIRDGQASWFEY